MNREDLVKLRLKVKTTTGINILCTAIKTQKVADWLPHFQQAYRQVKEDQGDDENSKQRFIKAVRIKKGSFYVANSETIGDVFEDNDEVLCQIMVPESKKEKKERKREEKKIIQKKEDQEAVETEEIQKPSKKIKKDDYKKHENNHTPSQTSEKDKSNIKQTPNVKPKPFNPIKEEPQDQTLVLSKRQELFQKVDLFKLKNLIMKQSTPRKTPPKPQPEQKHSKMIVDSSDEQ